MQRFPALTLAALGALVAVLWIVLLPAFARRPDFARQWHRTEQAGIDPAAFNYRELPAAEGIYTDLQWRQAARPEAWTWPLPGVPRWQPVESAPTKIRADFD